MGPSSASLVGFVSYGAAALAFLALAISLLARWRGQMQSGLLAFACASTALSSAVICYGYWFDGEPGWARDVTETLRNVSWIAFLWSALAVPADAGRGRAWKGSSVLLGAALLFAAALLIETLVPSLSESILFTQAPLFTRLLFVVAGLVLTESLFRNTPAEERWGIKFLCLATGGLFVYDLILYADAILFRQVSDALFQARGAVQAMAAPLLAVAIVRSRIWRADIHVSRQVALHSTALIAGGVYLFLMAAAGFYVRTLGGASGPALQIVYFVGAAILLAVVLFSGTVRSNIKVFLAKHFYSHKYDYRDEWLRFMRTLSAEHGAAPLEERAIKAIADIVDSPAGAMWLLEGGLYRLAASRNIPAPAFTAPRDGAFARFLTSKQWVIDLKELETRPGKYEGLLLPEALPEFRQAWLVVPLWHHGLAGFVVLSRSRAPRKLGWEDYDLLKTVGRQAASYLAERRAAEALETAREFEIFNRRFAFVVHDIKNLMTQLSLGAHNLEKHGGDPGFRTDMARTIADASDKMRRLMGRINAAAGGDEPGTQGTLSAVPLKPLIDRVAAMGGGEGTVSPELRCEAPDIAAIGDPDRIVSVLRHLVQNAVEAAGEDGSVVVALGRAGGRAIIEVSDDGPGMDPDFVRDELFKPFRTSKQRGMGIGAFQCREYVREMGGELDVISEPGSGTIMRVTLPAAETIDAAEQAPAPAGAP